MYWIQAGHLADQQAWVNEQMASLVAAGRTFGERDVQIATVFDRVARPDRGQPQRSSRR